MPTKPMSAPEKAVDTETLKLADMWSISGRLLHTPSYCQIHASLLARAIGARDMSILDAACGTGFPMIELHELGYRNLTGSDADPDLLQKFRTRLGARPMPGMWRPNLIEALWQELPQKITTQFDVVLAVDAAIGFMDSWMAGEMRAGPGNICARVIEVLRNFHAVTRPGGRFFIGLQKNNHRGNSYYPMFVGKMLLEGVAAEAHWHMTYDWQTRIKTWVNIVRMNGHEYTQTRCSYLFDRAELADFLKEAGFARVDILPTPDVLYEDILIAHRAVA